MTNPAIFLFFSNINQSENEMTYVTSFLFFLSFSSRSRFLSLIASKILFAVWESLWYSIKSLFSVSSSYFISSNNRFLSFFFSSSFFYAFFLLYFTIFSIWSKSNCYNYSCFFSSIEISAFFFDCSSSYNLYIFDFSFSF